MRQHMVIGQNTVTGTITPTPSITIAVGNYISI